MKFWQRANIYATIIEQPDKTNDTISITQNQITAVLVSSLSSTQLARAPSSLQIKNGKNIDNTNTTSYQKFSSMTDSKGNGVIFFNDLKPGSIY